MPNGNRKKLFNALNNAGFDIGSYDDFDRRMNNADDRAKFYDAVQAAGYDIGGYADFDKRIRDSKYALITKGRRIPVSEKEYTDFMARHPQQGGKKPASPSAPKSATPRQQPAKARQKPQQGNGKARKLSPAQIMEFQRQVDSFNQYVERSRQSFANQMEYIRQKVRHQPPALTINKNVVRGKDKLNLKTGKFEATYLTSAGNEYFDRTMAEMEQNRIDDFRKRELRPVEAELRDAYAERDRLSRQMNGRYKTLDDAKPTVSFGAGQAFTGSAMKTLSDDEFNQLSAAYDENHKRIKLLEAKRRNAGFFGGLTDAIFDPRTWTNGLNDLKNTLTMLSYAKGGKKTDSGEQMLESRNKRETAEATHGDDLSWGYGVGKMAGEMLPFAIQIGATGGFSGIANKGIGATTSLAGKVANPILSKTLKYTGVVASEMAAGLAVANTAGVGNTLSAVGERYLGHVDTDEQGNYSFAGGENGMTAFVKGELGQMLEYGTEGLGKHLHLGSRVLKGLDKIGASKITNFFNKIGGSRYGKEVGEFLGSVGIQGYPEEVMEEEINILMNSILVGDNKLSDLWDSKTQKDIWGGMLLSLGFMGALPTSLYGGKRGYDAYKYQKLNNKVKDADRVATFRLTDNVWTPLRERIDNTPNNAMQDVIEEICNSESLAQEEKEAALNYIRHSMVFRGYNMGTVANMKDVAASGEITDEQADAYSADKSYTLGYNTTEPKDMQDLMHNMDYQRERISDFANSNDMAILDGNPTEAFDAIRSNNQWSEEEKEIATEYVNARNSHVAMLQRINDDADALAKEGIERMRRMRHSDGSIRPATLKEKDEEGHDKQVYVVDGNVQMLPDGTMVDAENSDKSVVVYNPATGKREIIDPTSDTGILTLGEVETAEQRETAIQKARDQYVQRMIDEAQGTVRLAPGQQITLPTGEEAVVTAIDGDNITVGLGNGSQANVSLAELQRIRDEKAMEDYRQRHGIADEQPTEQPQEQAQPQEAMQQSAQAQPQQGGYVSGAPAEYTPDMELTIRDEDGTEKPAMTMGMFTMTAKGPLPDVDGKLVGYWMDGEPHYTHITEIDDKVVSHLPAQSEPEQGNNATENIPQNGNNAPENIPQQETPATVEPKLPATVEQPVEAAQATEQPQQPATTEQPTAEPMPMKEDGEEDYYATTPERAHSYIFNEAGLTRSEATAHVAAQADAANKALVKAKSQQMPSIGTSIKKFNEAKARRQAKIDEAQRAVDYWNRVREIQNGITQQEAAERAAANAVAHDEAVAQAQADYEARKRAEAERKAVGNENPMPAITEKWNTATKVDGHKDEMVLPNGEHLKGRYVLHEAGVSSPSHNSETWAKTEGFPMDSNDNSVNDRDYERDRDAQQHTEGIAQQYDSRALQNVPVVSNDGVVLSGNGRTMAGEIAARRGTDGAYLDYLKEYAHKFGFTPGQVEQMRHPRVAFVPDEAMPYTAETFAKFNQQEMKSQNKTEQAVKLGKTVSDDSFGRIVRTINGYDTLGDFYNDPQASLGALYDLHGAGVIPQAQMAEMVDGMKGQERLSAVGREFLENMLIGKAFDNNPEVVRMLTAVPGMRQTVITALGEISDNIALGEDWSLQYELADAVKLVSNARNDGGYQHGDIVSVYARQGKLFADPGELQTVADFNNATMLMLADVLNDKRVTMLKKTLTTYNDEARQSASGQMDIFSGVVKSREDILRDVINYFKHANKGEYEQRLTEAVERRKAESVQQDGVAPPVDGEEPAGDGSERRVADDGGDVARQGDLAETKELKYQLSDEIDENGLPFVLSPDGEIEFGRITADTGLTEAPILLSEGMITAPATNAGYGLIHIEARHGEQIRSAGYKSVVDFINEVAKNYEIIREGKDRDGNQTYLLQLTDKHNNTLIVELSGDGTYWNINTAGIFKTSYGAKRNVVYNRHTTDKQSAETAGVSLSEEQSGTSSETSMNTPTQETSVSSEGKGSEISATDQTNSEEIAENKQPSEETAAPATVQEQVEAAAAETNTEPTPAQREAGNYKKGHVTIGDFDITIENPAGSERKGVDADGKPWSVTMRNTYGYIKGTEGVDGDHIDVFLAEDMDEWDGRKVFVVDQTHEDGSFNEHKVMLGFNGMDEALEAYASNYEKGWLQSHPGIRIRGVNIEDFNKWVQSSHRKTKPFAEYVTMKPTDETEIIQARNDGYTIDKQSGILKNADAFVVNFNERADKDTWRGQTAIAKKFGGYYKRGKGFVFRTEEAAHDFAETAMGRSADEVKDEAPLSVNEVAAAAGGEQATGEQPKQEEKKSKSKWVNDEDAERFEELRKRLRQKLGGQLNMGIDPEAFAIGVEMSYLMLKKGARKFHEFAKQMIDALGENVRPYIKSFYNGARDLPEMAEFEEEMTPYDEVRKFDIANFDNQGAKDIVATAEHVVREQAAEREAQEATDKLKAQRNEQRKEIEQQVAADTETAASKATAVASEVESKLPTARTEREVNDLTRQIDDAIAKVDDQLAVLGYYEAEPVESDFNEAYGYKRNAEKKAVKDITRLGKRLAEALGISDITLTDAKGNKVKNVHANIAPAGGDITLRLPLRDGVELYMDFSLTPADEIPGRSYGENLRLTRILFRPERGNDYLRANNFFNGSETMAQMLHGIRAVCKDWLPVEDYVDMAARIASEAEVNKIKEIAQKGKKSPKKSVSSQKKSEPVIGDLFAGMFDEANEQRNETRTTRKTENSSRTDGTVGRVPADRDRVLDTRSTGRTDRGGTARVSDETGTVADGERERVPGQRSERDASRGDNSNGEGQSALSERGQRIGNRNDADGRDTAGRTDSESQGTPRTAGRAAERLVHGDARGGRRGVRGRVEDKSPKQPEPKFTRNHLYPEDASDIDNMTPQQRLRANVEALEVVRTLMKEGRPATVEEREVLGRYRGWGGVDLGRAYSTDMMRRSFTDRWVTPTEHGKLLTRLADVIDELDANGERKLLSAINHSALTSYYTPTGIAKAMNRFAELAGFKGGTMLDPSMGSGIFEGTMSKAVQQRTMIHGIELDWLTGQIARNLYPDANVQVTGYQDAGTADNAYDVVMSNIPFGDFGVSDTAWKHDSSPVRKAAQNRIHNYFAVKMLGNTRPGGLCVIMTSNAILDTKGNQIIREHLADNAEVLGVVRLPDNTFKGAGTSAVTDVIFLRKFKDEADRAAIRADENYLASIEQPFLSAGEMPLVNPTDGRTYKVRVNGYFTKNKGMMIGEGKAGGQYRADGFGLTSSMSSDELASAMTKLVEKKIVGSRKGKLFDTHKTEREVKQAVSEAYKGDGNFISSGNIVEQDGLFGVVSSTKNKYGDVTSTFTEMPSLKSKADRIRSMLPLREAMKQLVSAEINGEKEALLQELRQKLQKAYDAFVKKHGRLNDKANDFLTEDIDGYTLRSLEKLKDGKFVGLSDIFTKNTIKPSIDLTTAKTPQDAISLSLAEFGEINSGFMEDVLGSSWAEQCGESLFKEPFTNDTYVTRDAYLSGDVKTKLEQARKAAEQDPSFLRNVDALEAVQPKDIPFEEINIRMGARWIPAEVYTDFMFDRFGIRKNGWKDNKSGVAYMPEGDQYVVNVAPNELGGEADQWRAGRVSPSEVFTAALQDKSRSVFKTIKEDGKEVKVLDKEATELVNSKIQDLRTAFEDWLGQNPEREEMLMRLYNDKFNRTVLRKFDGSHLRIPGLMGMELRPHQKDAVWMLVNNRGGIVDHIVGAGKTLVMQSAIMEMRRMGIAKKPMIIGLKATAGQIAKEFREAYPAARILAPTENDFSEKNRKKFMSQIALNDYDCVILSHDQFVQLPHTDEVERAVIDEQMSQLDAAIEYLYGTGDKSQLTKKQIKGLEKRKANLEAKLKKLLDRKVDREFTFEGLGVDYLFVDECQHFKSLPYVSTYDRVAGLGNKGGSQRAVSLLNAVRYLQRMHQGDRGTVFLSGTTISNSLSEIYHLLNYLRPSEMERLGFTTFDAWAGNFAIHTSELEYGVTSELKEKDRFRSLTNIPELATMYAEIADVRNDMNLKLPKPKMRSHIVTVPQTELMQEINREIVNMVRNKDGKYFGIESKDTTPWGLLASTLSAKAAINPRLIDEAYESEGGKIPAVCEQVKKIYDQFSEQKGTQLIFCDTGVPGKGKKYDAYNDIINRLVNDYGIPRSEIADIHEANTDEKRKALFAKVNEGSVRILIGGTKNMGTGVNVQKRIVAMHHVDVPWTPADREQREGRGVRQGNEIARDFNDDNVDVYFYATEGSLDMYKYQLQETKGKLFAQFKSGTIGERTFDEGDAEGDFDPAEVVAMLSGNPVIFEKSKQDKKVEKLRRAKRAYESDWQRRKARFEELKEKQYNYDRLSRLNASDVRELERGGFTPDEDGKYPTTVTVSVQDDYASRRTFDKPKEAGGYIHDLLKKGKKVQLSGFGQEATITVPITDAGLFGKPIASLEVGYGGIKYTAEVSDDDTAAGVAFRNLLQKVYSNRRVYERNAEDVKNQLTGADPGENVFPKQKELDEALKEKKRLDEEYKKLSEDNQKPNEDGALYRIVGDPDNTIYDGFDTLKEITGARGYRNNSAYLEGVTENGEKWVIRVSDHPIRESNLDEYNQGDADYVLSLVVDDDFDPRRQHQDAFHDESRGHYQYVLTSDDVFSYADYFRRIVERFKKEGGEEFFSDVVYREGWGPAAEAKPVMHEDADVEAASGVQLTEEESESDVTVTGSYRIVDDPEAMRSQVERMGRKFGVDVDVIEHFDDAQGIAAERLREYPDAKGWYDPRTGKVAIVLYNNRNVADVAATMFHEVVGHRGLRELVGEENYNAFLREVYAHAKADVRRRIAKLAAKHGWDFEKATDEYLAGLAEKGFEDFTEGEKSIWQWLKDKVLKAIDKFLQSLNLPKWVKLGDNELRYMLWRSHENLRRGTEHPIDFARDMVKREELKLGEGNAVYADTKKDAHSTRLQTSDDAQAVQRSEHLPGTKVEINSENEATIGKNLQDLSEKVSKGFVPAEEFLASLRDATLTTSEDHSGYNSKEFDGVEHTLRVSDHHNNARNNLRNREFKVTSIVIKTPFANNRFRGHKDVEVVEFVFRANELTQENEQDIIKGIQQWLETGQCQIKGVKPRVSPNPIVDEVVYRDPDETEDIWRDQSMGLHERITAAATRLAANHQDNKTLRNDAMRAIGGNLADLRKAMSLQRQFDMTTVKRVYDLARVLMNGGYLDNLSQQEVKRLLAAVKNSVGHNDIEGDVQKVMDIMVDNQLKNAEHTLRSIETIKGSKVNARGVEVQGQLDPTGQHIMKVFKKSRGWEKTDIEEALADAQQRMGSADQAVADEAAHEYTGLQLAMEYAETIKDSETDEQRLRDEIKQAHDDASESDRRTDSYRQYIAMLQEAIRQNKIERAQAYHNLVGRLTDSLRESIANAQAFKEAEKQRIGEIHHDANSDMEGRASDEHYRPRFMDKFVNNSFVSFLFAPLSTFDQMLRLFGSKSANGEGYLYNRFMRGWVDARQKEITGVRSKYAILDNKAAELFGGKVKNWGGLIRRVGKLPKATVSFWNGGEMQERELTQGNLMYIYMVNKMLDGRMKLRKMGITEEDVANIEQAIDPRLIELADWLQDEFLVETRNEYNETHKRMFGASMAAIENYFPLKILANARADKPEDLDNPDKGDGISTATGSIIKRRRNALALDITCADALSVILDHVTQMEHWNAFAEFNRDLNTLRTYKRFRNQVQNMTTIYGSGKELWKKFNDVCQMAAGTYRPPRVKFDEAATNFAKGVTAAKVSFRMFTAWKQFLSMPAYIPEARVDHLAADIINPVGAWKWSMEHLPIFNERWKSRMSGDPRLLKSDMDWKMWRTRIMQLASRAGMSPNAFVDALTVSIGAHAMYKTRKAQYLKDGYDEQRAEQKAIQDAEVLYNQTQQSSEGAFTSTMQVDRSWFSVLFTVFRNSSMAYQRQLHDALRNMKRNLTPGGRAKSIEFMKKQFVRDGIDEAQAEQNANRKFRRQLLKDTLRVATFGYIIQLAWNLGSYLPYLLLGDDDDEKQKMLDYAWARTMFGSLEGFTGGDLMSQAGQMIVTGEGNPAYLSKDMPLTGDIMTALQKLGNGKHTEALNDIINLVVQSGIGVNPQSITDIVLAIMDACGDDPALAHEAAIFISRILQVPQSQIDKMYFDELGLSGSEVSKYTPAELAERYARYKVKRGNFFSPWSWNDEERIDKQTDKANKTIKERTQQMGDAQVNEAYLQHEEVYKGIDEKFEAAMQMAETDYVKAARMMREVHSDPQAFATYQVFKETDKHLDKIAKMYLGAKSQEEAALCQQTMIDYKAAMVNALNATDAEARAKAMQDIGALMQDFSQKYTAMQPKQPNR